MYTKEMPALARWTSGGKSSMATCLHVAVVGMDWASLVFPIVVILT